MKRKALAHVTNDIDEGYKSVNYEKNDVNFRNKRTACSFFINMINKMINAENEVQDNNTFL